MRSTRPLNPRIRPCNLHLIRAQLPQLLLHRCNQVPQQSKMIKLKLKNRKDLINHNKIRLPEKALDKRKVTKSRSHQLLRQHHRPSNPARRRTKCSRALLKQVDKPRRGRRVNRSHHNLLTT